MKVARSTIERLKISETKLDPISVYLEDLGPGRGKITIECFGKSWSASWPAMGKDNTVSDFVSSCDHEYLIGCFGGPKSHIIDNDKSKEWLKSEIKRKRRCNELSEEDARSAWDDINFYDSPWTWCLTQNEDVFNVLGENWWCADFPQKVNPKYEYLCSVINTVKEGIKKLKEADEYHCSKSRV
jgi:hypothetical protein